MQKHAEPEQQAAKKKGCTDEAQPFDELDVVFWHLQEAAHRRCASGAGQD